MLAKQSLVPRLPLPPLADTLRRFTDYVRPLPAVTENVDSLIDASMPSLRRLHAALEARELADATAGRHTSYVSRAWDDMYLGLRSMQAVHTTPFLLLAHDHAAASSPSSRLATLLARTNHFARAVRSHEAAPNAEGAAVVDSMQLTRLFCAARLPAVGRDAFVVGGDARCPPSIGSMPTLAAPQYAVVFVNDRPYELPLEDESRRPRTVDALAAELDAAVAHAAAAGAPRLAVGQLTSAPRDEWARTRALLSQTHARALARIDGAVVVAALDTHATAVAEDVRYLLGGDGSNRWWDKQQLAVSGDADASILLEHTATDGASGLRWVLELGDDATAARDLAARSSSSSSTSTTPRPIDFDDADASLRADAESAEAARHELVSSLDVASVRLPSLSSTAAKAARLSPDAVAQSAFQLAYARAITPAPASTYESVNTQRFLAGRTETMRSVTDESVAMTTAWPAASAAERGRLLRAAATAHAARVRECRDGLGVERHLYAMRDLARASPETFAMPPLLESAAYSTLSTSVVSTSQVSHPSFALFGFGPVCENGIGVAYNLGAERVAVAVTSFEDGKASGFGKALEEVAREMDEVLTAAAKE